MKKYKYTIDRNISIIIKDEIDYYNNLNPKGIYKSMGECHIDLISQICDHLKSNKLLDEYLVEYKDYGFIFYGVSNGILRDYKISNILGENKKLIINIEYITSVS